MTAVAVTFAAAFVVALVLFTIAFSELLRLYPERDRLVRELRIVRGQRDLADSERAALQAEADRRKVVQFGPVQRGLSPRLPRQRNGEGA